MKVIEKLYFKEATQWQAWLHQHHASSTGVYLIFYKVSNEEKSMRWEDAVKVAICYGWIDSTVKSLGEGKRQQYFCPRKPKSAWSKVNKNHIKVLISEGKMHASGLNKIKDAKIDGSWNALDDVENRVIPKDLQQAFSLEKEARANFLSFAPSYQKSYLYWLYQAKRDNTRHKRILEIITLCKKIKSRGNNKIYNFKSFNLYTL